MKTETIYSQHVDGFDMDEYCAPAVRDKKARFNTFLHYSDPTARQERTVFGSEKKGLFYNYDDRLIGQRWSDGLKIAKEKASPGTAEFYEIALNHFHHTDSVDLQHVILGCNMSNGFSYLVFGYTYDSTNEKTATT